MFHSTKDILKNQDYLTLFPEAKTEYILPRIRELESEIAKLERTASSELSRSKSIEDGWFAREIIKEFRVKDLNNLNRDLRHLRKYLPQPKQRDGRVDENQIDRAKEYPILQIAETYIQNIKRCGRAYRSLCPYHTERTPSFFLYPNDNTFHCFGCQEHGDVISLTQKLQNITFIEAVKYLAPSYAS